MKRLRWLRSETIPPNATTAHGLGLVSSSVDLHGALQLVAVVVASASSTKLRNRRRPPALGT